MGHHPTAPASKKTVLLRQFGHTLAVCDTAKRNHIAAPSVIKKVVENGRHISPISGYLHNFSQPAGRAEIDIPADNLPATVTQNYLLHCFTVTFHPGHELQKPNE